MEEKVYFQSGDISLSGLLHRGSKTGGVVITHPHPLYGGNMFNSVVEAIGRVYRNFGWTTLRFNFRGVGESQGAYGEGIREQEDVVAAVACLQAAGVRHIDVAGYSFGAWVNALAEPKLASAERLVLVSPPVAFLDFSGVEKLPALAQVITGSEDELAPPEIIAPFLPAWNSGVRLTVIDKADHFFFGFERELEKVLAEALHG